MKRHYFLLGGLIVLMIWLLASACRRDDAVNENLPASYIQQSERLEIPAAIALPANQPNGNSRVVTFYAEGVQKYKARVKPGSDPQELEWVFVAPLADLYDMNNRKAGVHGAGPYWKLSTTDSIRAEAYNPAKTATATDAYSIDWLLLKPLTGSTPTGIFSGVEYIQRIATNRGKAPAAAPRNISDTVDVRYTAVYRFSKRNL